ncbi:MAG: nucleoside hydrolase [Paraglaciecola sp.]|uniref:nucleoside hydrolase n=1 Tax=Paraglaciecola sp. TaxID=1920173 RepID=UPI0027400F9B|nr:nucleoside hydrolase [Paraglaciecola sp.]MDP5032448.1 nucleoside hydrolase [Paraglaciecola sp.]MDP5130646.1 nucleoside hydrolase [Paraglaciecola sp.]
MFPIRFIFCKSIIAGFFLLLVFPASAVKVIYDTDMGIDDWSAMLVVANHPDIELLGITSNGAGEGHCEANMRNIPDLLALSMSPDVPFACGYHYPLDGYFAFPEPWRKQADTLSGVAVPPSARQPSKLNAVELLHQLLSQQDEKVVLLTAGSLTNIALWLQKYPQDKPLVSRLVMMGGGFDAPGNIIVPGFTTDHPNKKAEWNIYVDAIAADRVFQSGLAIEVVGLDLTNQVKVTAQYAQRFKAQVKAEAARFWDQVLDDNDWFIESGEYYFWDVLAALVVADPHLCQGDMQPVWVEYQHVEKGDKWTDKNMPPMTESGQPRRHYDPATFGITHIGGDNPPVKICRHTEPQVAFDRLIEILNIEVEAR